MPTTLNKPSVPEKQVLVVEDNPVVGRVLKYNLERSGLHVTWASDGCEALELVAACEPFELIVTDYQMPSMSGEKLCRTIRAIERYKDVPILMVTGKTLELDVSTFLRQLGLAAVLSKPFSPAEIVSKVHCLLEPCQAEQSPCP